MKTTLLSLLMLLAISMAGYSQKSMETVRIKTSAHCEMCKDRLDEALKFTKGVKSASLDLKTKEMVVEYNPEKVSLDAIKSVISKTGYDADDVKRSLKAYAKLPKCCREGHGDGGSCSH